MKREDGHLLQRWSRQELRVREVTHGGAPAIRLVQWRFVHSFASGLDEWRMGRDFDGVLTATAQRELLAYLTARSASQGTAGAGDEKGPAGSAEDEHGQ